MWSSFGGKTACLLFHRLTENGLNSVRGLVTLGMSSGSGNGMRPLARGSGTLWSVPEMRVVSEVEPRLELPVFGSCLQNIQVRHRTFKRRIMGHPRPPILGKIMPEPGKYRYLPILPKDERYTTVSLPIQKLGGRDPVTGRVVVRKVGGGNKKKFRWIDTKRHVPEGTVLEEKVFIVRYDPLNSFLIALVANGGHKRWIIASENMKPGDIIRTYNTIPRNAIRGEEGDAWPVGALAPGSLIHNVEMRLGEGGSYIKLAGSCAEIVRRMGDKIVIKGPSKREIAIDERCMAVVGKVSNTEYETINRLCPQRSRWMGDRPASGLWHKKDGYCGRKIRPPKPLLTITSKRPSVDENHIQKFTLLND